MSEEEVIEKIKHIDRYKDSGDVYTRDDVIAIGEFLKMYNELKVTLEQTQHSWYEDTLIIEKIKEIIGD